MALKVGIVGMHGIGVPHANAYQQDPLAELVAICDLIPERADQGAQKYGTKAYYSLQDMLANEPDLDIVDVCTGGPENGGWHYQPAMQAMEAGKHVLVEKPLSNDLQEAREMVAKAAEKGVYLGCNLNHYFTPPAERARQYLQDGEVGELVYCLAKIGLHGGEVEDYRAPDGPAVKGFPYFHLKAFLSHPFSVMRYLCGDIAEVQAFLGQPSFRKKAGDVMLTTASIHVRFANGGIGYLLSQRGDASYGLGGWWSIEVAGTRGTFCIENCIEKVTFWKAHRGEADPGTVTASGTTDFGETFPRRIHAFLEDLTRQVPPSQLRASGRDALAALEYTFAAIQSYEQGGQPVQPHPLPPLGE
jgi:predicted dehydrogenase